MDGHVEKRELVFFPRPTSTREPVIRRSKPAGAFAKQPAAHAGAGLGLSAPRRLRARP